MKQLQLVPVQSSEVFEMHGDLEEFLILNLKDIPLQDGDVLAVTSKILSLAEGRSVARSGTDKKALIEKEADQVLAELPYNCTLTLKHGLMMIAAGIDESNSPDGSYLLYPRDPWASAQRLRLFLSRKFSLKNLGVILTDSHTIPLRRGVVGISLAHAGFRGTRNCIGQADLFGQPLKFTHQDLPDGLAAAAVFLMGEGNERIPMVLIRGANLDFIEGEDDSPLRVPPEDDLYFAFFKRS